LNLSSSWTIVIPEAPLQDGEAGLVGLPIVADPI
jgi:hypothetical protein